MTTRDIFDELESGDHILFNDKKVPLRVEEREEERVFITGPQGGEYVLYPAPDYSELILVSRRGDREYASKVEDLRVTGHWVREEDTWEHTKTGAQIAVMQNELGYWTLVITGFDGEHPDLPKYGFVERKYAVEEAAAFMERFPEG